MTLTPINDNVIIFADPIAAEEKTTSGIILTSDTKHKPPTKGVIVGIGPDARHYGFTEGDRVLFGQFDFDIVKVGEQEYSIGKGDKILGLLDES